MSMAFRFDFYIAVQLAINESTINMLVYTLTHSIYKKIVITKWLNKTSAGYAALQNI